MTYSLNTLNVPDGLPAPPPAGVRRVLRESVLIGGFCVLAFWLMALLSYSVQDPAWTGSGMGAAVHNWGGRIGALVAEALDWAGRRDGSFAVSTATDAEGVARSQAAHGPAGAARLAEDWRQQFVGLLLDFSDSQRVVCPAPDGGYALIQLPAVAGDDLNDGLVLWPRTRQLRVADQSHLLLHRQSVFPSHPC